MIWGDFRVRHIPIPILLLSSSVFLVVSSFEIVKLSKSLLAILHNILLLFPVVLVVASYLTYDQTDIVLQDYASLVFVTQSIVYAIITAKMIVCAMARTRQYSILQFEPFILYFYWLCDVFGLPIDPYSRLIIMLIISIVCACLFAKTIVVQITEFLGIYCFSVKKRN